jgi:hypothetical protein
MRLTELANDDRNYQEHEDCNNSNRYNPICSHPDLSVSKTKKI